MPLTERQRAARALRDRMDRLDLNPAELAAKSGVDVTTVRGLLRGDRWPRLATRTKLAAALGVDVGDIPKQGERVDLTSVPTHQLIDELRLRCPDDGH